MTDDCEPPPLEDMTEELESMGRSSVLSGGKFTPSIKCPTINKCSGKAGSANEENLEQPKSITKRREQGGSGFGGFQKGFLSGSKAELKCGVSFSKVNTSSSSSSKHSAGWCAGFNEKELRKGNDPLDDVIRPKVSGKQYGLEFPEVQQAMKELNLMPDSKWICDLII